MSCQDQYWICEDCAKKRGWTCEFNGVTMIRGLCGYCKNKIETFLTPVRDFKKTKGIMR